MAPQITASRLRHVRDKRSLQARSSGTPPSPSSCAPSARKSVIHCNASGSSEAERVAVFPAIAIRLEAFGIPSAIAVLRRFLAVGNYLGVILDALRLSFGIVILNLVLEDIHALR